MNPTFAFSPEQTSRRATWGAFCAVLLLLLAHLGAPPEARAQESDENASRDHQTPTTTPPPVVAEGVITANGDTVDVDTVIVDTTATASADSAEGVQERMAVLIGGLESLRKEVKYPRKARRKGIEGRVIVQFDVSKQGIPTNINVTQSVHPLLDEEAVRAVGELRFLPGIKDGEPVIVRLSVPVGFFRGRK